MVNGERPRQQERPNWSENSPAAAVSWYCASYAGSYDVKETILGNELDHFLETPPPTVRSSLLELIRRHRRGERPPVIRATPQQTAATAEETVRSFAANHAIVESLAASHHFKPFFIWHPYVLAGRKALTPHEQQIVEGFDRNYPAVASAIRATYAAMSTWHGADFYDLKHPRWREGPSLHRRRASGTSFYNVLIADQIWGIMRRTMTAR